MPKKPARQHAVAHRGQDDVPNVAARVDVAVPHRATLSAPLDGPGRATRQWACSGRCGGIGQDVQQLLVGTVQHSVGKRGLRGCDKEGGVGLASLEAVARLDQSIESFVEEGASGSRQVVGVGAGSVHGDGSVEHSAQLGRLVVLVGRRWRRTEHPSVVPAQTVTVEAKRTRRNPRNTAVVALLSQLCKDERVRAVGEQGGTEAASARDTSDVPATCPRLERCSLVLQRRLGTPILGGRWSLGDGAQRRGSVWRGARVAAGTATHL
mmetsp:Transcript_9683/g.30708  ORF Transcript_9683/g.30708 Transcript_9683/m.30708 type:complete len:266 (+) Transcript_9683:44-841(+)